MIDHRKVLKRPKCKHTNQTPNPNPDNLKGDYYEWTCNDCGYKKLEGRTAAHKELYEYALHLKTFVQLQNMKDSVTCLGIIKTMTDDALKRLRGKGKKEYFEEVF